MTKGFSRLTSTITTRRANHSINRFKCAYGSIAKWDGLNTLRVAIIGSGPAGFYAAQRILRCDRVNAYVDMFEKYPVPYGLVRFGVAPQHADVKKCRDTFDKLAKCKQFTFIGNVEIGKDVDISSIVPHYNAILFTYGASKDVKAGIEGEGLAGVYTAREIVGWYNGHPEQRHLNPSFEGCKRVVIIGHGNVALDVAHVLLSPVDQLKYTDITQYALETLSRSTINEIRIIGRRGPYQVSFTSKEFRELSKLTNGSMAPLEPGILSDSKALNMCTRPMNRLLNLIHRISEESRHRLIEKNIQGKQIGEERWCTPSVKEWALNFFLAPKQFHGKPNGQLEAITFARTRYTNECEIWKKQAQVTETGTHEKISTDIAICSFGYYAEALPGLQKFGIKFDRLLGRFVHENGRLISSNNLQDDFNVKFYCAGWTKTGSQGQIANTMMDSYNVADLIIEDFEQSKLNKTQNSKPRHGWQKMRCIDEVWGKVRWTGWDDWKRIEAVEYERGKELGKVGEKIVDRDEMLRILDRGS